MNRRPIPAFALTLAFFAFLLTAQLLTPTLFAPMGYTPDHPGNRDAAVIATARATAPLPTRQLH